MRPPTATAVPLGVLDDAELVALVPPRPRAGRRPVLPRWARLAPTARGRAAEEARGSLRRRGLTGDDGLPLRGSALHRTLTLRHAAGAVVAVVRTDPGGHDHWYAHVVDDVVLLEQVSDEGRHCFALAPLDALPDLVAGAVLHPRAGEGEPLPTADVEPDWLRADVVVSTTGRVTRAAWVSGPGGCWPVGSGAGRRGAVDVRGWVVTALALVPAGARDG